MLATLLKRSATVKVKSGPGCLGLGLGLGRILPFRRNGHSLTSIPPTPAAPSASASTHADWESTRSRYFICDNAGSVARARQVLQDAPYVLFDCEGHTTKNSNNVKTSSGSGSGSGSVVSLVQMGTPHAEEVFIFDMLALNNQSSARTTTSVLSLLSNPRLLKVGWGGVQDYISLSLLSKSPQAIKPFLDLQLVDIHSRLKRREKREGQVRRLASPRLFPESVVEKMDVGGVHGLSKMDDALVEHRISCAPLKEAHRGRWTERPLNISDIRYAVHDIVRISELHNHFRTAGYLSAKLLSDIIAQTAVYMQLCGPSGILNLRKRFVPSNILPLDILNISVNDPGKNKDNFFMRNRDLKRCRRCHRALSLDCFPAGDGGGPGGGDSSMCKVCLFILEKERYIVREAARRAKRAVKKALKASRDFMV